jgi:hypothetical protein
LALVAGLAGPALAQAPCRLALLLALDVSSSVDDGEYALMRDGLAAALTDPDIEAALLGQGGTVALGVYEWSGRRQSVVVQDWVTIRSAGDIAAVAARLRGAERSFARFPTALGYALGFGATMMARAPDCARRVIDVAGDGITNDGFWPRLAYEHFAFDGITVNGLAVLGADPDVVDHYRFELRRGPGSFVETAPGYDGFRAAMVRKLYREIEDRVVGAAGTPGPPG